MLTMAEQRWLDYAWRVAECSPNHRSACELRGGAAPRPGQEGNVLRWPGYLGREYTEGKGLLCVGHVHGTNWDDGEDTTARTQLEEVLHKWRSSRRSDAADSKYLEGVREVFEWWLPIWKRWDPFAKVVNRVGVSVRQIAWTNLAKCRAPRGVNNDRLIQFCQREFPIAEVVAAIRPLAVLTCAQNAFEGGSLVRTWKTTDADPLVFTWHGMHGTDRGGRRIAVWSQDVAAQIRGRLEQTAGKVDGAR